MLINPFNGSFPMTQDWNDPRYRSSYTKFGLLGHNGQDFGLPVGTPILSPHAGKVIEAAFDATGYGWYIKIESDKEGSVLGHFKEAPLVNIGDSVTQGQQVGLSGNTGNSTGPHLHWGYYRFPRKRDNGFSGTIDQTHWKDINEDNYLLELNEMRDLRDKWKLEATNLSKKIAELNLQIESMQKSNSELTAQLTLSNKTNKEMIDSLNERINTLTKEKTELEKAILGLKSLNENMLSLQEEKLVIIQKLEKTIKELKAKLDLGLDGFSRWDLFIKLIKG